MRRRRRQYEEEAVELGNVLEPYGQQNVQQAQYEPPRYVPPQDEEFPYDQQYEEEYDYSDAHEAADDETRFRVAMGIFDMASILVGIVVILGLVAMLVTLLQWLNNDILHSAVLITSGLQ